MAGSVGQPTQAWFPWVGHYSSSAAISRNNDSSALGMGYVGGPSGINAEMSWQTYMDSVTWKIATISLKTDDSGIISYQIDGSTQGTVDLYASPTTYNNYNEITGISITTAGVKTVNFKGASKNASSSNYRFFPQSIALIRTGGTPSTPAGTDTPGYTWEHIPWMGSKSSVNWNSDRTQNSALFGGGWMASSAAQNNEIVWDVWLEARTYKYATIHSKDTNRGIYTVYLDAASQGTIDGYAAGTTHNTYSEITGLAVASAGVKAFKLKMETKNASASDYYGVLQSVKWISTGA